jgi:hypothetical protein
MPRSAKIKTNGKSGGRLSLLFREAGLLAPTAGIPPIGGGPNELAPGPPNGRRPGIGGGAGLFTKVILRLVPVMDKSHSRVSPNLSLLVQPGTSRNE